MIKRLVAVAAVFCFFCIVLMAVEEGSSPGIAVRAGKLITMDDDDTVLNHAVLLIKGTRFEAMGKEGELAIPDGYKVIDARNSWVVPGLVDFHSHSGGSLSDLNDSVYLTNPGLRSTECLVPASRNEALKNARAAGLTTLLVIPGSGTNMSGFGIMYKATGRTPEEAIIRDPGCMKMAQAGNPERYWYRVGRSFMYWNLRTTLNRIKDYHDAWCAFENNETEEAPDIDIAYEPFRDFFRGKYGTCMHTQAYQVCLATFKMMHDHFGFWTVPTHSTFNAYKLAELAEEREIVIIAGPRNIFFDRNDRRINGVPAKWCEGGVTRLGTETDAPVVPIEEHTFQAAMACRMGWEPYPALKGITRITAKGAMLDHLVGSIEIGKDADLGVWTGDPLDPRSSCRMTIINGKVCYDKKNGQRY